MDYSIKENIILNITKDKWQSILAYYSECMMSSLSCSIASVNKSGEPNVTPIGSLVLKNDFSGYFFDKFTNTLSNNLDHNNKICVLLVNSGKWFWLKSLLKNKFIKPSGLKLSGTAGKKRKALEEEIEVFRKRIQPLKIFRGYHTLWDNLEYVRDIKFTEYYPVFTGKMTFDL